MLSDHEIHFITTTNATKVSRLRPDLREEMIQQAHLIMAETRAKGNFDEARAGRGHEAGYYQRAVFFGLKRYSAKVRAPVSGGEVALQGVLTSPGAVVDIDEGYEPGLDEALDKSLIAKVVAAAIAEVSIHVPEVQTVEGVLLGRETPGELAAREGLPPSKVYKMVSKARKALRENADLAALAEDLGF